MVGAPHRIGFNGACVLFAMCGAGCASYPADPTAWNALESDDMVTVEQVDDLTAFLPVDPSSDHAFAFYPGAKVEPEAYAPLLRLLAEQGVASVLISMPSDLAVLAPKKGDKALDEFGQLGPWYAAGHSLGGAMAATWFSKRLDALEGLALLASYPGGGTDLSNAKHPVVSITASNDRVLDAEKWRERKANLPDDTLYVDIEGGNHAGFGAYGPQDGDGRATLASEEQWQFTVDHLLELVD